MPLAIILSWQVSGWAAASGTVFYKLKDGLPHPSITAVAFNQGWLWVGTEKGLAVRPPGKKRFTKLTLFKEQITAIAAEGKSAWVGTRTGLFLVKANNSWEDYGSRPGVAKGVVYVLHQELNGQIWLGSESGLSILPPGNKNWKMITLPAGVSGPVRAIRSSGSMCYIGAASPDLLIIDQDSGRWLCRTPPQAEVAITAISVYGSSVFIGTDGQGIWHFSWKDNSWSKIYPAPDTENCFVLSSAANGRAAWFGTFDTLLSVDQEKISITSRRKRLGLAAGAMACLSLAEHNLLIGTESGLAEIPLDMPRVACQPQRSVMLSPGGDIKFTGLASSPAGVREVKADFAVQDLPEVRIPLNIYLGKPDKQGRLQGRWEVNDLPSPSDFYLLRLRVTDKKGVSNTSIAQLILAPKKPVLRFSPVDDTLNEGLQMFSGTFDTPFASEIIIDPGRVKARLNSQAGTFQATVKLVLGKNQIQAEMRDWFGRRASASFKVEAAADISPATTVRVQTTDTGEETLTLNEVLLFDTASVEIKKIGLTALHKVVDYLNRDIKTQAVIVGYTDNIPIKTSRFPNNQALSKARARAVYKFLVKKKDINALRLTIQGRGESRPIASNKTKAGRAKNRRVEIIVKQPQKP